MNFHHHNRTFNSLAPTGQSITQKLVELYKLWHNFLPHFPKTSRYTLSFKIDSLFIEITEYLYIANYSVKKEKLPFLQKASKKLDLVKFFLQVSWEIKALDNKKYIILSENVNEIGKMLGGWIKQLSE